MKYESKNLDIYLSRKFSGIIIYGCGLLLMYNGNCPCITLVWKRKQKHLWYNRDTKQFASTKWQHPKADMKVVK